MPIFVVTVIQERTALVLAETSKEAEKWAQENVYDIIRDCEPDYEDCSARLSEVDSIEKVEALNWDPDACPFGENDRALTCRDYLESLNPMPPAPADVPGQTKMFEED